MVLWKHAAVGGSLAALLLTTSAMTPAHAALVVSSSATQNVACAVNICSATAANAVMNAGQLRTLLASHDVTLVSGSSAGDIQVAAAVFWASSHTLTLDAFHGIAIAKPISVTGPGGLTLTTNDGGASGLLSFTWNGYVNFLDLSSPLTIDGNAYTLVNNLAALSAGVAANPSGYFALAGDYSAIGDGIYNASVVTTTLQGAFEGLGNKIDGLAIRSNNLIDFLGLFRTVGVSGKVENIALTHAAYTAKFHDTAVGDLGGIAGFNNGLIQNAIVYGQIRGWGALLAGGIAGSNEGQIRYSRTGTQVAGNNAGGIAGNNLGTITNCHTTGRTNSVQVALDPSAGGIAGLNTLGTIALSYATGDVTGKALTDVGGIAGINTGQINQTYALGNVTAGATSTIGGLVGANTGAISQSYAIGHVNGGALSTVGGFVGTDVLLGLDIASSYWDMTTSGKSATHGAGNIPSDPGITGLTDAALKAQLPSGLSPIYWGQSGAIQNGLPYLLALPPA
jgi:hypothetical protein